MELGVRNFSWYLRNYISYKKYWYPIGVPYMYGNRYQSSKIYQLRNPSLHAPPSRLIPKPLLLVLGKNLQIVMKFGMKGFYLCWNLSPCQKYRFPWKNFSLEKGGRYHLKRILGTNHPIWIEFCMNSLLTDVAYY